MKAEVSGDFQGDFWAYSKASKVAVTAPLLNLIYIGGVDMG